MEADWEAAPNRSSPPFLVPRRSYPEMILDAIDALADENASNEWAISGYIKGRYGASLPPKHFTLVPSHLARMICTGEVLLDKNNYRRRPGPAKRKNPVAEDPNDAPVKKRGRRQRRKRKDPVAEPIIGAFVTPTEAFVVGAVKGRCGQPPEPKEANVAQAPVSGGGAADANAANASLGSSPPLALPLPPYPEMILEAIEALGNENSSDSTAIEGYIEGKYGSKLPRRCDNLVLVHLSLMKATGEVLSVPPATPKGEAPSGR